MVDDLEALEPPPAAQSQRGSREVLRVWALPGGGQQFTLRPTWKDPAAWGLLLVDVARHAARAYASEGYTVQQALERIRAGMEAEWSSPTDAGDEAGR